MTSEQIHLKLDNLLADPKTKNYINHIVRNYIPINRCKVVYEEPDKDFICTLTKKQLISGKSSNGDNSKLKESVTSLPDDEQLALTGWETNTFMSYKAYKAFYEWIVNKITVHDKHISWLLGDLNRKEFVNDFKGIVESKPLNTNNKNYNKPKTERATFALGDFSALQELKKKLK